MKNKKIVFMGTPEFAVPILKVLKELTNVVLVVTQPDKEKGRKKELVKSPVKLTAEQAGIPVFQPRRIREDFAIIKDLQPDLIVTCAYGQILPEELLAIPKFKAVNVHASLLPLYRGASPIERAIMDNQKETGITLMYMDAGMDTGDIIATSKLAILPSDTGGSLRAKLSEEASKLLKANLEAICTGKAKATPQPAGVTYAPLLKRSDEHINFQEKGVNVINKIRALNPTPLANFLLDDKEIKVEEAIFVPKKVSQAGLTLLEDNKLGITVLDGIIYLTKIKPAGKKKMDIKNYLNGCDKKKILASKIS